MSARWRNWAGDEGCAPAAFERPGSRDELRAAVAGARSVRVAGSGHSFSDLVCTPGTLVSLERMDRVLDADHVSGLVRVEAGITLRALNERLAALGLALENLGDIDAQSVAGAIATATHGTGGRRVNLPAQVQALELVLADGSELRCSADDADVETFRAARVSLGALGVVAAVTLRCVPAFTLRGVDAPMPLEGVLGRLDELVDANDHFELYTFPHTGVALTRTNNRVDLPPAPPSQTATWLEDIALVNGAFDALCRVGRRRPAWIPAVNRLVTRLAGARERVDASHRIFTSPRLVRFTEMEYAIPRAEAAPAVRAVLDLVARERLPVSFPLELRFVAPDNALLSPASGRQTAYVAVHAYRGMPWGRYFRGVEEIMDGLGGRPHWGKRHFQTAETLRPRYPDWDRFQAVRARLDPEGRFTNAHIARVLGPVANRSSASMLASASTGAGAG